MSYTSLSYLQDVSQMLQGFYILKLSKIDVHL